MMKPEMHRGGLALIFFCVCGFGREEGKGRVTFNIFSFFFFFFSSKKTLFFHHILH